MNGTAPSYNNLTAAYGIVADTEGEVAKILARPLSFLRAGSFSDGVLINRYGSGYGSYWSSWPNSLTYVYSLVFSRTAAIGRTENIRRGGRSVRCVMVINGGIDTDKSYGKLVYVYTGATENSNADKSIPEQYEQAVINEGRINKLLVAPTEFVYGDYYNNSGALNSRPIGHYWSASVYSATNSRDLYFNTNGTTRILSPQGYSNKGNALAVRCVGLR